MPAAHLPLVIASCNPGKIREMRDLLQDLPVSIVTPEDLPDLEETGTTYEENACLKARSAASRTGCWALADDSGLEVDALDGRPGVHSNRFTGAGSTEMSRNQALLELMAGRPDSERSCRYRAVVALSSAEGDCWCFAGSCEGRLLQGPRGEDGFGYDPLFLVTELNRTMAELTAGEKNRISHRGLAVAAAAPFIRGVVAGQVAGRAGCRGLSRPALRK